MSAASDWYVVSMDMNAWLGQHLLAQPHFSAEPQRDMVESWTQPLFGRVEDTDFILFPALAPQADLCALSQPPPDTHAHFDVY